MSVSLPVCAHVGGDTGINTLQFSTSPPLTHPPPLCQNDIRSPQSDDELDDQLMLQDEDKELDTKELLKVFRRMPSQMLGYFLLLIMLCERQSAEGNAIGWIGVYASISYTT